MSPATPDPAPQAGGAALELLVHGVGGATPQDMLGDPRTVRVTGDATAAVYRRTDDSDAEHRHDRDRDGPVPEAYCWSNLTSGNGARALWLLLLPFMVVNLAHWMRPATTGRARTLRLYGMLVRLVALSLTVLFTAAACEVALDLTAWQCAGSARCSRNGSWIGFLSASHDGWWSQPGRRLSLAALLPAALVGLLWYLSNRTWSAYEAQRPPNATTTTPPAAAARPQSEDSEATAGGHDASGPRAGRVRLSPGDGDGSLGTGSSATPALTAQTDRPALGRPGFWYGRRLVGRLRAAHTAAGFLVIAAAVTGAAARHDRSAGVRALELSGSVLEAVLVLAGVFVVAVVVRRGRSEEVVDNRIDRAVVRWLPCVTLVLLAVAMVYGSWSRPGWASQGTLPGEVAFRVIALAQGALVVTLAVAAHLLHRRARQGRAALWGLGGPAVALLACALGGVMTGGVAQRVADWLDGSGTPGEGEGAIPGPPVLLSWQASVIPVLLLLLLVPLCVLGVRTWRTARALEDRVEQEYPDERPDHVRTRRIAGTRARAGLTDAAPAVLGIVCFATLLLGAGAVAGAWVSAEVPGEAFDRAHPAVEAAADVAQALGSWLIGLGFILFVTWGRRAYRDASARRTIGILWDVGTFWPRAAHPFAPPCYAERAVPDLTWRMASWTSATGGRLVISGHSQGSVLAAAAVWQLTPATRRRVALLTYGSPLERLYGRWFPAYFGAVQLRGLHRELHCWRNLWRHTDPIGGPVRLPAEDGKPEVDREALKDPVVYGRTDTHPLPEPVLGHSDYQADPAFAEERRALLERLPPALPRQRDESAPAQGSSGRSSG
ncbi:hypothetical protein QMZ92_22350 [Streptomyces sp. HNM0645]|uniref:hypothetical protein n=1 Tax=Streptomyces sp. HNM0645 TaxID=2782343 RepID=UPI0024B6C506|nr:hypothetical protein [Streptomyces sp. HNM0645]MDI9887035.1 hypothetical protein [Streptomyces sp. HNM0645]